MPPLRFEYHPEAIAEARAAYQWYARRSPVAANRFADELTRARRLISEQPDRIIGLAICHFRRRPGYWWDRQ